MNFELHVKILRETIFHHLKPWEKWWRENFPCSSPRPKPPPSAQDEYADASIGNARGPRIDQNDWRCHLKPSVLRLEDWVVATQIFFIFTPIPGEMIQFDEYFSNGLKPPTRRASVLENNDHPENEHSAWKSMVARCNFLLKWFLSLGDMLALGGTVPSQTWNIWKT